MVPVAIECSFGFYSAVNSVRYSSNDNYRNTNFYGRDHHIYELYLDGTERDARTFQA